MLFDYRRTHRHCGSCYFNALGVVGITDCYAKGGLYALHGTQVNFCHGSGVFGGAVQHCDACAGGASQLQNIDGRFYIAQRRHTGGQNGVFAKLPYMAEIR